MINPEGIKTQKFGLEVECTGLTRAKAAKAIGEYFGKTPIHTGGYYDKYEVIDDKNRKWTVMSDASIKCQLKNGDVASKSYSVEFVTPVCEYEDIPHIQEIVRRLRKAGGICNSSTGLHIHINAAPYDAKKLRNLVNIVASKEEMIYKAFKVDEYRKGFCGKTDPEFIDRLNKRKPTSMETLKKLWYNGYDGSGERYHNSRYHLLNLHSVFQKGTVEFRAFNSTLHSGVLRAYLSFCLAISNQALQQKSSQFHVTFSANEKYTFRTWLIRIGLNGEEFQNCRKHLLSHLEGCIAWKNPEQAVEQRQRLKMQREAAREQAVEPVSEVTEATEIIHQEADENEFEQDFDEDLEEEMGMVMSM